MGGSNNKGDGLASQPRRYRVPGQPLLNRHQVGGVSRSPDGLFAQQERESIRGRLAMRGKRTYGGQPGQRVEKQGTWASCTQKHSEAGYGRPVDRGVWTAKTVKQPWQQPAHPQYANYWAPLTRKRHVLPHPTQPQHTNYWAPQTRKRHQQEHRPQRPTESSNPTQHAKGRTGDCPGPRKGSTTRRNVTQGVWHKASVSGCMPLAAPIGLSPLLILTLCGSERVLVVSTEPLDDLSCLTTPGSVGGGGGINLLKADSRTPTYPMCLSDVASSKGTRVQPQTTTSQPTDQSTAAAPASQSGSSPFADGAFDAAALWQEDLQDDGSDADSEDSEVGDQGLPVSAMEEMRQDFQKEMMTEKKAKDVRQATLDFLKGCGQCACVLQRRGQAAHTARAQQWGMLHTQHWGVGTKLWYVMPNPTFGSALRLSCEPMPAG